MNAKEASLDELLATIKTLESSMKALKRSVLITACDLEVVALADDTMSPLVGFARQLREIVQDHSVPSKYQAVSQERSLEDDEKSDSPSKWGKHGPLWIRH